MLLDGQELTEPPLARLQGLGVVAIAKYRAQLLEATAHRVHTSATKDVRFSASNMHIRPDIGTMHAQKLAIQARGLKFDIHSSEALRKDVGREHTRHPAKYMHLNLGFPNGIPKSASGGVFAEMAGIVPMTKRTRTVLKSSAAKWALAPTEEQQQQHQLLFPQEQEQQHQLQLDDEAEAFADASEAQEAEIVANATRVAEQEANATRVAQQEATATWVAAQEAKITAAVEKNAAELARLEQDFLVGAEDDVGLRLLLGGNGRQH